MEVGRAPSARMMRRFIPIVCALIVGACTATDSPQSPGPACSVSPTGVRLGDTISIRASQGARFGSTRGRVIDDPDTLADADVVEWSDSLVRCVISQFTHTGYVRVVPAGGLSISPAPLLVYVTPLFVSGSLFTYDEWSVDSNSVRIDSTRHTVRELILGRVPQFDGRANVFQAVDTLHSTIGYVKQVDTLYYDVTPTEIWAWGSVQMVAKMLGWSDTTFRKRWNKVADVGNILGWFMDTSTGLVWAPTSSGTFPISMESVSNGNDSGTRKLETPRGAIRTIRSGAHGLYRAAVGSAMDESATSSSIDFSDKPPGLAHSYIHPGGFQKFGLWDSTLLHISGFERTLVDWKLP